MSEDAGVDFLRGRVPGFGAITPQAEEYHGKSAHSEPSLTETWWFTAHAPEQNLSAYFYIWTRPNLGVCSAGTWIWRDFPSHPLLMEHQNFQGWLPLPTFEKGQVTVPGVGLTFEFLKPLERSRIIYRPPNLTTSAEFEAIATMPVVMRGNERHFEQTYRVEGQVVLDGKRVELQLGVRDRSWGEPRPEDPLRVPPISWMAGMNAERGVGFNLSGTDTSAGSEWEGIYQVPAERQLLDGWIYNGGQLRKVVKMTKRTRRIATDRMRPALINAQLVDDAGHTHELSVTLRNGTSATPWPNLYAYFALIEWELDGVKGFGDLNDFMWSDYAKRFWKQS